MLVYRPRRPLAKLTLCLVCATLASCELPHAIAAEQPFTPLLAAPPRAPVVMVLTAPIPLPRWVEAAASAPSTPRFQSSSNSGPAFSISLEPPVAAPPLALSTVDAPPPQAVAEPSKVSSTPPALDMPRSEPESTATKAESDPVIQIATPTYFDRPPPAPPAVMPATSGGKPVPVAVTPAAAMPSPTAITNPPTVITPAASTATAATVDKPVTAVDGSPQKTVKPATTTRLPADVPTVPAPASSTPVAAASAPLPGLRADSSTVEPLADPIPVKTMPLPAAVEVATAASPAASPPPSPSLQITGGRFAGMPLPNLPALTPQEPAAEAAVQTARNDEPPAAPPAAATATPADETAAARTELRRASERTGLTALQLARIEESRRLIEEGNAALALDLTRQLNADLDAASTTYIVKGSENLWQIAELPEVYGNAYLWPLILRANTKLKQPSDVQPGMRLRIPTNPGVLEVTGAIDYARRADGEKMQPVRAATTSPQR